MVTPHNLRGLGDIITYHDPIHQNTFEITVAVVFRNMTNKDGDHMFDAVTHSLKSIANSAIEIARIKSLENGFAPVSIVRIDFYYHIKIERNVPDQTTIFRCHPKWNNDSNAGISGREWFDWVEVNWEKGDGSSSYTDPSKLLLWGNVVFSNITTILLACIRSLKSETEMKIHKRT